MALERINVTTYQKDVVQTTKTRDFSGKKTDYGMNDESKVQTVNELNGDQKEINEQYVKEEIAKANNILKRHNIKCEFDYHEETNRIIIRVTDKDTKEVIREIPPEKTLNAIQKMWELAGLLIDERR